MKQLLSNRLLRLAIAFGAATALVVTAQTKTSSASRVGAARAVVSLQKTALGTILADARGRTLYLFEKDRNGVSSCSAACLAYWPALTSIGTPRAGNGVHQSLLKLVRAHNGSRQVTYAGHPLYTFVGDKRAGQTTGEGLRNFGADWYALAASGRKVDRSEGTTSNPPAPGRARAPAGGLTMAASFAYLEWPWSTRP
jgi:predicted lipoprotein with Yx(FWY)xxD motif